MTIIKRATMTDKRQHAHELIDRVPDAQLSTVVGLLENMVDPALEDEEISDDEAQTVARSKEWFKHNPGTPIEEVAAELGFTMEQVSEPQGINLKRIVFSDDAKEISEQYRGTSR
jgi:hypothetical protein